MGAWRQSTAVEPCDPSVGAGALQAAQSIRRLPFSCPPVLRKAWVSDAARECHEARLARVAATWTDVELRSAGRARPCALRLVPVVDYQRSVEEIEAAGGAHVVLRVEETPACGPSGSQVLAHIGIGRARDLRSLRRAWTAQDHDVVGGLLGYPACCRAFFQEMFVRRGFADPVWLIGCNTPAAVCSGAALVVDGLPECNIVLRRLGLRLVPHFPCSFVCEESARLARAILAAGASSGQEDELLQLRGILGWSVSWSAFHGVAEIRTAVLKLTTQSDTTVDRYELRLPGRGTPEHAATGLRFPYVPAQQSR
jgi:hypothetical protein